MKHEDCLLLLDDFADDLLPAETAAAVGLHLRSCASCADELERIRALKVRAASMPSGVAPPEDPWPGIARRLDEISGGAAAQAKVARPWFRRLAAGTGWAAAAAVAFALLWPGAGADSPGNASVDDAFVALDSDYASLQGDGRRVLAGDVAFGGDALASGMSVIDQAIRETRAAMDQVQGTPDQIRRLTRGYQKKLDLLQHLVQRASGS